jgi:hypothetical protein
MKLCSAPVRALLVVALLAACGGNATAPSAQPASAQPAPAQPAPAQPAPEQNEEKFTGAITEIDFGCAADARCSLVVDGTRRVAFGHDTRGAPPAEWGNSDELFELMEAPQQGVGRRVEVYAAKTADGYTLRGKAAYYIKVLP